MGLRIISVSLLSLVLLFTSCSETNAEKTEEISIQEEDEESFSLNDAKNLYTMKCASCHGSDWKLGMSGAKDLSVSKITDQQIMCTIQSGQNAMPAFKDAIPDYQLDKLVAVVKSLRK